MLVCETWAHEKRTFFSIWNSAIIFFIHIVAAAPQRWYFGCEFFIHLLLFSLSFPPFISIMEKFLISYFSLRSIFLFKRENLIKENMLVYVHSSKQKASGKNDWNFFALHTCVCCVCLCIVVSRSAFLQPEYFQFKNHSTIRFSTCAKKKKNPS